MAKYTKIRNPRKKYDWDCVYSAVANAFAMDINEVFSKINTFADFKQYIGKEYSCIYSEYYDQQLFHEIIVFQFPDDNMEAYSCEELLKEFGLQHIEIDDLFDIKNLDNFNFLIQGFDMPQHCFGFPYYYRNHMMWCKKGTIFDDEFDHPFYIEYLYLPAQNAPIVRDLIAEYVHKAEIIPIEQAVFDRSLKYHPATKKNY